MSNESLNEISNERPNEKSKEKRVLILSHPRDSLGGVTNFVNMLLKNDEHMTFEHFPVGARKNLFYRYFFILYLINDVIRLALTLIKNDFYCVHINPSLNYKSLLRDGLFMSVLHLFRCKCNLVFFHGWNLQVEKKIEGSIILRFFLRNTFGRSAMVLVLASSFKTSLINFGFDKNKVKLFSTMFDGNSFKAIHRTQSGVTTILFMSRLVKEKGIYELLDALNTLFLAKQTNIKCIIAGDGPEYVNIKRWIAEHNLEKSIVLTGYLRDKEKTRVLINADIFAFPTYYGEGCPVSILEAMAAGLAIITTKVGGIPDILVDSENALLLDHVSSDSVRFAIERLLNDKVLCNKLKENSKSLAWCQYESRIVRKSLYQIYSRISNTPQGSAR